MHLISFVVAEQIREKEESADANQHRDADCQPQMKRSSLKINGAGRVFETREHIELPGRNRSQRHQTDY